MSPLLVELSGQRPWPEVQALAAKSAVLAFASRHESDRSHIAHFSGLIYIIWHLLCCWISASQLIQGWPQALARSPTRLKKWGAAARFNCNAGLNRQHDESSFYSDPKCYCP